MKSLGICVGASSISIVGLQKTGNKASQIFIKKRAHNGNSKKVLLNMLNEIKFFEYSKICVTGRKFRKSVNLTTISEPEAVEFALQELIKNNEKYNALVSAGGETIIVYELNKNGRIQNVFTGNKCASGTGSFLIQQLARMKMKISDLNNFQEKEAYEISGRCSVFCKSDCTHALNKGVRKDKVIAGLCKMMGQKITSLLTGLKDKNIIITGGIAEINPIMEYIDKNVNSIHIPEQSGYFEAYGAALWSFKNKTEKITSLENLIKKKKSSFDFLPSLSNAEEMVEFKSLNYSNAKNNDKCILGVDIGSTTTKAVLIRKKDNTILAHVYLRTNGNPIKAAKECYKEIKKQIQNKKIKIIGLGTTGSGRYITGLHAMTKSIYNEIICHAAASIFFDKEVDTIFEIGGQDAKYTYITQGIPSDYAMNEACSAGTGSFLEEIAKESLNIQVSDIAEIALNSLNPPNFNDQCSAFISSDIQTAFQEGIKRDDIIAGLVYSICQNYNNRVRGARPFGKKIFMQGGVCYNKAVPIAMASLLNTKIVVPPDPGLMGAFGCALEIKKRLEQDLLNEKCFDLQKLINRKITYKNTFICMGGKEKCDRKCKISMLELENRKIPFGGACNKYYNLINKINNKIQNDNLVALRDKMIFEEYAKTSGKPKNDAKKIGINRTFLTNKYYPLYFHFWDQLGFKVVLSDDITNEGREKKKSSFCFPAEIAHGAFHNLLNKKCDYIFMPHITNVMVTGSKKNNKACVFVQGEPYYIKEAFKDQKLPPILKPVIDFQNHNNNTKEEFVKSAAAAGANKKEAQKAFDYALEKMKSYFKKAQEIGNKTIKELEKNKSKFAVVLIGRWYNALAKEANMSIPYKFVSRGIKVIPFDFIPFNYENLGVYMHWGSGKTMLQVAKYIKDHPQLFATYVTNFSCGPDSFIVPYFRDIMGKKPSLTLELDSHTADVGLNTRIEAAIDIICYYRQLKIKQNEIKLDYVPAKTIYKGKNVYLIDSDQRKWDLKDPNVTFLFPKMGKFLTEAGIAALKGEGFNAKMVDQPDIESLSLGKANSSCKECLPYIVCVGSLMDYIKNHKKPNEKIAYFIIGDPSPCRLEQYQVGLKKVIEKNKIRDVAVHTLSSKDGFAGMGLKPMLKVWEAFCLADVMEQIYSAILTLAVDKNKALQIFEEEWIRMRAAFERKQKYSLYKRMKIFAKKLSTIKLKNSIHNTPRITITGEMYVRNEQFCRQFIEQKLAKLGFLTKITPLIEWQYYVDYIMWKNYSKDRITPFKRLYFLIKRKIQSNIEKKIKKIFYKSGLYEYDPIDIKAILNTSKDLVDNRLIGDVGITIGVGLRDSLKDSCGIISLGPFACIQTRMAEAILNSNMSFNHKMSVNKDSIIKQNNTNKNMPLPFLAIESDGNPFPQIVSAKLEVFALQAKRIGEMMRKAKKKSSA